MSHQLRFLFVIDNLNIGGAQRQLVYLANGMVTRGHSVEIYCYTPGDSLIQLLDLAGIEVHRYVKQSRFSPDVIINLSNLVARKKYDLLLSFMTTPNFYTILVGRLLNFHPIPIVVSERRIDLPNGARPVDRISREFYRLATHIVTNSYYQQGILANKYPWLESRLSTIYNGIDLELFAPANTEPNNQPLKILAIASVVPHKNVNCLIEALNILNKQDGHCPIVDWIGRQVYTDHGLDFINQANYLIHKYGLFHKWHWLNLRSDIVNQLHSHDVFVHPSFTEGLPNVVCEALACARPVIVSDALDHARLVRHNENGYLFDFQNPADLAEKIRTFMNLPVTKRSKMGKSGRHIAESILSKERLVDDYEQLFLRLISSVCKE